VYNDSCTTKNYSTNICTLCGIKVNAAATVSIGTYIVIVYCKIGPAPVLTNHGTSYIMNGRIKSHHLAVFS
jgi:hypothetical protein